MARTGHVETTGSSHPVRINFMTVGAKPMTAEDNAATYRRPFDEGCSQGNLDLVDELYSREYVTHSLPPNLPPTRDGLKTFMRALRDGIPDLDCPSEQVVAESDRVARAFSLGGTHSGTL